jgi:DNA-binding NtrC family response regulator
MLEKHPIEIVLLDIVLGTEDGLQVLKQIIVCNPQLPIIMITGYGSIETAVKAVKIGAFDYVQKPLNFNKLLNIIESATKLATSKKKGRRFKQNINKFSAHILTQHPKMFELCNKAQRIAATDMPVLILGENGTGKELLAHFIHNHSHRNTKVLSCINCAAFPESLLDNELFGHEKGAYTGADGTFSGIFEKADGGSLLLDEIGDMALSTQAKILRTIQNSEIRRIGGNKNIHINVRFIASTNKDLSQLIKNGCFREDLFYRINAATLQIPPLRERINDIPVLVDHFLRLYAKSNLKKIIKISDEVLKCFFEYPWPGNIRELKNTVNYAATMTNSDCIEIKDLPSSLCDSENDETNCNIIEETEKIVILRMLKRTNYNKKKAAKLLKISRKTLYNKLKKYGISLAGSHY